MKSCSNITVFGVEESYGHTVHAILSTPKCAFQFSTCLSITSCLNYLPPPPGQMNVRSRYPSTFWLLSPAVTAHTLIARTVLSTVVGQSCALFRHVLRKGAEYLVSRLFSVMRRVSCSQGRVCGGICDVEDVRREMCRGKTGRKASYSPDRMCTRATPG